jgi:hypothetical protein
MNKTKPQQPILKIVPPSPWLKREINGVAYWVHKPSRKGGIHIRGLAKLCGVTQRVIQNAIRNTKKDKGEVTQIRETELNKLLKDKIIFLEEVTQISPNQQGGPVKVICSDVCADLIHYYAKKGNKEAIQSILAFARFGIEQFIFIQVGFIPTPESIILNDIEFLIAKETVQVNKSRQEEARFFTNPITGECGIALQSLSFLCGGVAQKHIEAFLEAQNEPFLSPQQPEPIVKAPICSALLQHFGFKNTPRKTVAQHWFKTLDPIVPVLHKKTNYQAPPQTNVEAQLRQQLAEALQKIDRLEQLSKEHDVQNQKNWHRLMGLLLERTLSEAFWEVRLEAETTRVPQYLDVLILKRPTPMPQAIMLPDGLTLTTEINLLSYKSHQESLTIWTIQELIGHYVSYRKILAVKDQDHTLPDATRFQLYAITTMYPTALATQMGTAWQVTEQSGVYRLIGFGLEITVIVTRQIPPAPHNRPWNLLSHDPKLIRYAVEQEPLPEDLARYFDLVSS